MSDVTSDIDLWVFDSDGLLDTLVAHGGELHRASVADLVAALLNETSTKKEWRCSLTRITDQGEVLGVLPGSATWWKCFEGYERHDGCGWAAVVPLEDE